MTLKNCIEPPYTNTHTFAHPDIMYDCWFHSEGTDNKLVLLEISISRDWSSLGRRKHVQFHKWFRLHKILYQCRTFQEEPPTMWARYDWLVVMGSIQSVLCQLLLIPKRMYLHKTRHSYTLTIRRYFTLHFLKHCLRILSFLCNVWRSDILFFPN